MEAFKKWWSEELSEEELAKIRSNAALSTQEKVDRLAKESWRAALKWALKTAKELDEQDAPIDMRDVIEHELEEK